MSKQDDVVIKDEHSAGYDEYWGDWFTCPKCGKNQILEYVKHCPNCGVKLTWDTKEHKGEGGEVDK